MELGPTEAVNLIASGEFEYLDVRTPEEFAGGRCPKSVNIPIMFAGPGGMTPNDKFMEQVAEKFPNPETDHIAVVNGLARASIFTFAKCVRTPAASNLAALR